MSLISDIADYLEDQSVGTVATNIFYSYLPDGTNTALAVIDTGGVEPDPDLPTEDPTFQVFIRAADYDTGKTKLDAVRSALHQVTNTTIGDYYFYYILAISEGGHLGRNENGRDEFSINFRCKVR